MLFEYHEPNNVWRYIISLKVHCRDVGFDCYGILKAETEDALLHQVAKKHAQSVHELEMITDEIIAKVKSVIREE